MNLERIPLTIKNRPQNKLLNPFIYSFNDVDE